MSSTTYQSHMSSVDGMQNQWKGITVWGNNAFNFELSTFPNKRSSMIPF